MKYFIFDFEKDAYLIDSFLEASSKAHKQEKKTEDWFLWKFRDAPFGETILACAEDNDKIVGCVAYGIQDFLLHGNVIKGVLSFETFVHPDFQGAGIFSKLIKLGEKTVSERGIDFMLNFPNSNSLRGFLKGGWKQINSPEYWLKGNNILSFIANLRNLRLGFKPNKSNLGSLQKPINFNQILTCQLTSVISQEYLNWRFFSYSVAEYIVVDTDEFYSVVRMGKRGKAKEGQVLFINSKISDNVNIYNFIKALKKVTKYDFISFSISNTNKIRENLRKSFFIKVPNKTNICYKILNSSVISDDDVSNISLNAINYHTY